MCHHGTMSHTFGVENIKNGIVSKNGVVEWGVECGVKTMACWPWSLGNQFPPKKPMGNPDYRKVS